MKNTLLYFVVGFLSGLQMNMNPQVAKYIFGNNMFKVFLFVVSLTLLLSATLTVVKIVKRSRNKGKLENANL
jgi:uncharacterized membrane protein YdcZ (DUF606 family)